MPRFKVGDRVKILPFSATPFVGLEGTIHEVLPNNRDIESAEITIIVAQSCTEDAFRFIVNTRCRLPASLVNDWVLRVK